MKLYLHTIAFLFFLALPLGAEENEKPKMDPPPKPAKLNNDKEYEERYKKVLEDEPGPAASDNARWSFLWRAGFWTVAPSIATWPAGRLAPGFEFFPRRAQISMMEHCGFPDASREACGRR